MGVIAGALGGSGSAVAQIEQLFDELGVPRRLGEFGLADEHLDAVAAATMTEGSALAAAPLPVRQEDVHRLLREAL
jgi:alcohol dehydrogenase class IV